MDTIGYHFIFDTIIAGYDQPVIENTTPGITLQ